MNCFLREVLEYGSPALWALLGFGFGFTVSFVLTVLVGLVSR